MVPHLGIRADVPIPAREAVERELPSSIARVVVYSTEVGSQRCRQALAHWLTDCTFEGKTLVACPLPLFISPDKMEHFLDESGLLRDTVVLDAQTYLIPSLNPKATASIMEACSSETIAFMMARDMDEAQETAQALDTYPGDYKSFEVPFMTRLNIHGAFFFYAQTHESLEILGKPEFVIEKCLLPLLAKR